MKLERNLGGIRDMEKLPEAVFILDTPGPTPATIRQHSLQRMPRPYFPADDAIAVIRQRDGQASIPVQVGGLLRSTNLGSSFSTPAATRRP